MDNRPELPVLIMTLAAALGVVIVFIRYGVTGEFSTVAASALAALGTGLFTVYKAALDRKKDGDKDE